MPVVNELIKKETDGSLSFGNYELAVKSKVVDFKYEGDLYKVKTYKDITKLERNGVFVYESVPGTAVNGFSFTEKGVQFVVEGTGNPQITVGLEADSEYKVLIDSVVVGRIQTNLGGKLVFSTELGEKGKAFVTIIRVELIRYTIRVGSF